MWLACLAMGWAASARAQVDVDRYLQPDTYDQIRISPTGAYYAATVELPDRTVLWISRRADGKVTAKATAGPHSAVADFRWVGDQRVIIAWARKDGPLEKPVATGELFGLNADGSGARKLVGNLDPSVQGDFVVLLNDSSLQFAELIDTLPRDAEHVLVAISSYSINPITRVARMDVNSGRLTTVASAPLRRARFAADAEGVVRLAEGEVKGNFSQLLYRADDKAAWRTLNDERTSGHAERPVGFSADGRTAFLEVEQAAGPDAIVAFDTATGQRTEVLRDQRVDPDHILYSGSDYVPVGAAFMSDPPRTAFFDVNSRDAVVQRSLEAAFPGQSVTITSRTADGQLVLFAVSSDRNPGDFYLYDRKTKAAVGVFSRRLWLDPAQMAATRGVELQARDGVVLHGYLTLPKGAGTGLPMVVLPHGGPFGIADSPGFDEEVQLLADAGYAVLRVNFRGSGNYGRAFESLGARQWGARMQDDVTDATRWAIAQKIADPQRICIYGASYGGYAAMMGMAREPDLYRCGVGYVGVYDLPMMYRDDAAKGADLETWFRDWVGDPDTLAAVSPTQLAARIKHPVLLAAGGQDTRAPIEHSRRMERALEAAGNAPETLYFPTEGHGFYTEEHRRAFYVKLLDFLSRNIGGAKAK
ncbi:MAG: S9 family peptidase [Mizugakiibacter sp.]|uniref:S9 family peptidase n=1 Tax=Mizugakiibacter sp. TaxID=1972610 RepID=UPI0031C3A9A4|nr:S9 family peptidase [Xanthomonadaceae bacterium]